MEKGKPGTGDDCKKPKPEPDSMEEDGGKKNHMGVGRKGGLMRGCQADRCAVDLTEAPPYHRRHRVCEIHAKAPAVVVSGLPQRFCQQCSRFQELAEFDEIPRGAAGDDSLGTMSEGGGARWIIV